MATIQSSSDLRQAAAKLLAAADDMLKTVMNAVNNGLNLNIAETNNLKDQLKVASEENRLASNKVQKVFDDTEYTWNQLRGPVSSNDLQVHERLNRPVIKVMQRHPGNQMPEAQYIVRNTDELLDSLQTTGDALGRLKLSQLRLKEDAASKSAAIQHDSSVIRMRKRQMANLSA